MSAATVTNEEGEYIIVSTQMLLCTSMVFSRSGIQGRLLEVI